MFPYELVDVLGVKFQVLEFVLFLCVCSPNYDAVTCVHVCFGVNSCETISCTGMYMYIYCTCFTLCMTMSLNG